MTYLIPTRTAEHLAVRMSNDFDVLYTAKNKDGEREFPDGELYVRLPDVGKIDSRAVILHSGMPYPNKGVQELEMLIECVRDNFKGRLDVFFSHFPYGRQDKIFEEGESIPARNMIRKLFDYHNVEKIYTVDGHFFGGKADWLDDYKKDIINVSAVPLLKEAAEAAGYRDMIYLGPDGGCGARLGLDCGKKKRKNSHEVDMDHDAIAHLVEGKNVAVVDDIIGTGGTLSRFYDECKRNGAEDMIALITHGVDPNGIKRMGEKYDGLFYTNSIKRRNSIDISRLIVETIKGK